MSGVGDAQAAKAQAAANAAQAKQQAAADAQWKKALAANAGGGDSGFTTNFEASHGLDGLRAMIESADPDGIHTVSQHWSSVGDDLTSISKGLGTHVNNLLEHWSGSSADAFRASATSLNESLTNGAAYANNTSTVLEGASQGPGQGQDGHATRPQLLGEGVTELTSESGDIQFKEDAAKLGLKQAIDLDGGQLSANEEAQQKAVLVMEKLGKAYNHSTSNLNPPPSKEHIEGRVAAPSPHTHRSARHPAVEHSARGAGQQRGEPDRWRPRQRQGDLRRDGSWTDRSRSAVRSARLHRRRQRGLDGTAGFAQSGHHD